MDTNGIWVTDTNLTPKNQEFRHQVLASGRSSSDVSKDSNTLATVMANEDVIQPKRRKAVKQIEEDKFRKRNRQVVDSKNTKVSSHSKQDQGRVLPEERIPPLHFPSQNLGNGLLVSVLKTDLGEILRRSYRERTNNSRFNDGALANDKECHTSLNRVKANSTEHNISLVSAARRLHLKKKNGMLAGRSITTVKERDIFGALKFNNVEENDKKLTVCRSDKARKSFPLRTSPNGTFDDETAKKPKSPKALIFNRSCGIVSPESSGFSSNDAEVALAPAADGSYLQVRSCMLKRSRRKGRHFKGSTYYLSIHPNRRKRRVHSVGNLASFTKAKLNHVLKKTSESMDAVPGIDTDRVDEADAVVNSNPVSIGEHFLTKCINKFNAKSRNGLLSETQQPSMKEGLQNTDDKSREERLETLSYNHAPSENYTKHFQTINMGSMDSKEMFCSQQLGLNTKGKLVNTSTCDDFSSCAQEVTGICHYPTSDNRISEMTVENILMMRGPLTSKSV